MNLAFPRCLGYFQVKGTNQPAHQERRTPAKPSKCTFSSSETAVEENTDKEVENLGNNYQCSPLVQGDSRSTIRLQTIAS